MFPSLDKRSNLKAGNAAPMRCESRHPVVRAIVYDGEKVGVDDVAAWVMLASSDPLLEMDRGWDGLLVVRERAAGSTRESVIRRGDIGVQAPTNNFGWDTVTAERFRSGFSVLPRECPVYETNDTAE
jgi:hypothetical protein